MRRSGAAKFPHSVQLFKFTQKVMIDRRGGKVNDQEVGSILNFNPSDCSHWKRGEKNVKSVFALKTIAETLDVEPTLVFDIASGAIGLDEAFFEYLETKSIIRLKESIMGVEPAILVSAKERIEAFVKQIHLQAQFTNAPLYLPEVMQFFSFVSMQSAEMMDKLTRILRVKPGQYNIHYKKGDLKPQTRMSMVKELSRIVFEAERERFPELPMNDEKIVGWEEMIFIANLLCPEEMVRKELLKIDSRKNLVSELATVFWVPKVLIGFQLEMILNKNRLAGAEAGKVASEVEMTEVI